MRFVTLLTALCVLAVSAGAQIKGAGDTRDLTEKDAIIETKAPQSPASFNTMRPVRPTPFDFDGDGRSDISVARPSDLNWYRLSSSSLNYQGTQFGVAGDIVTPADYDGDGITDMGIFRPTTGDWCYFGSRDQQAHFANWGQKGDYPLPSDIDGDGRADFVVVRMPEYRWLGLSSSGQTILDRKLGEGEDIPLIGDFNAMVEATLQFSGLLRANGSIKRSRLDRRRDRLSIGVRSMTCRFLRTTMAMEKPISRFTGPTMEIGT